MDLVHKKCVPCEGGTKPLTREQAKPYLEAVTGWAMSADGKKISRDFTFKDFVSAVKFINLLADIAESEGHHPDIHLMGWNHVNIELWTHAIGGLSDNDFIIAAKTDQMLGEHPGLLP